jgi:hypothetical protein
MSANPKASAAAKPNEECPRHARNPMRRHCATATVSIPAFQNPDFRLEIPVRFNSRSAPTHSMYEKGVPVE